MLNTIIIYRQPAQVAVKILAVYKRPNRPLIATTIKEGNTILVSTVTDLNDWFEVLDLNEKHLGYCRVAGVKVLVDEEPEESKMDAVNELVEEVIEDHGRTESE